MIHLFSRLVRLLSRLSRSKVRITELDSPGDVTLAPEPKAETPGSGVNPTAASPGKRGQSAEEILVKEARSLNDDVDAWISSLQLRTLEHERVQVGNRAYAYTMKVSTVCWLFRDVTELFCRSSSSDVYSAMGGTIKGYKTPLARY
jgi:hypothetical protein